MSLTPRALSTHNGSDRRRSPRFPVAALPYLTARVAGGPPVRLIDLSKHGVQVETPMRLPGGATVSIRFVSGAGAVTLDGAVVRSSVCVVETGGAVTYHTALAFTEELTLCGEELEATLDAAADAGLAGQTAPPDDYTMIVLDGRAGAR